MAERLTFKALGIIKHLITEDKVCYVFRYPSFTTGSWDKAKLKAGRPIWRKTLQACKGFFWFDLTSVHFFPMEQEWNGLLDGDANIISPVAEIKLQNFTYFHRVWDPTPSLTGSLIPFLSLHYSHASLSSSSVLHQSKCKCQPTMKKRKNLSWPMLGYYKQRTYYNSRMYINRDSKHGLSSACGANPPPLGCSNLWDDIMMRNTMDFWSRQTNTCLSFFS